MDNPCKDCVERKLCAKLFDFHFSGDDCPYVCEAYEWYKAEKPKEEGDEVG